jgi:hypothetical protein
MRSFPVRPELILALIYDGLFKGFRQVCNAQGRFVWGRGVKSGAGVYKCFLIMR